MSPSERAYNRTAAITSKGELNDMSWYMVLQSHYIGCLITSRASTASTRVKRSASGLCEDELAEVSFVFRHGSGSNPDIGVTFYYICDMLYLTGLVFYLLCMCTQSKQTARLWNWN